MRHKWHSQHAKKKNRRHIRHKASHLRLKFCSSGSISQILSTSLERLCDHFSHTEVCPTEMGCNYYPGIRRAGYSFPVCLASRGVYPASIVTSGAVGSYPTFSPLPSFGRTLARRYFLCGTFRPPSLVARRLPLSRDALPYDVQTFLYKLAPTAVART